MLQCQPIYRHMAYFYHTSLLKPKIRVWVARVAGNPHSDFRLFTHSYFTYCSSCDNYTVYWGFD